MGVKQGVGIFWCKAERAGVTTLASVSAAPWCRYAFMPQLVRQRAHLLALLRLVRLHVRPQAVRPRIIMVSLCPCKLIIVCRPAWAMARGLGGIVPA